MAELSAVLADLTAECGDLDALVADLPDADWERLTPSAGWTIAHQIAHLAWTDDAAYLAVTDPVGFQAELENAIANIDTFVDNGAEEGAKQPPAELLARWRAGRAKLADALLAVPDGTKISWFGPPMSAASMATARLMETWAHAQDVADALGVDRNYGTRVRNVAHIGVRTRDYAFMINGKQPPADPFRVELAAPDGELWTWGPEGAAQRVTGPAVDFALRVTQRRHRDDLALVATGPDAELWLDIAQAFAGPPGSGREPGAGL